MRLILEILIRFYLNKYANKEITKLSDEQELEAYQLKSSVETLKVIKSNITIQTLRHFECNNDKERWMVKGASLALQLIKDRHLLAVKLSSLKDKKKKIDLWKKFKLN
jgi:hypothetical protein